MIVLTDSRLLWKSELPRPQSPHGGETANISWVNVDDSLISLTTQHGSIRGLLRRLSAATSRLGSHTDICLPRMLREIVS